MAPLIFVSIIVALVPVNAVVDDISDSLYGTKVTLSDVGLAAKTAATAFTEMNQMDIGQQNWTDQVEEEEGDVDVFNQFIRKGHPAYPQTFQFHAALYVNTSYGQYFICGAILVSARRALTAAHCTEYFTGNMTFDHFIAVGVLNRTMGLLNPGSQISRVLQAEDHQKFSNKHGNDISMLYLEEDIVENKYVHFAKLATPEMGNFDKHVCLFPGWGLNEDGELEDILHFGYKYITPKKECRAYWAIINKSRLITGRHICGHFYPASVCNGDSGGALICGDVVVGILSWALDTCSGCFPDIFTRISSFEDWIAERM